MTSAAERFGIRLGFTGLTRVRQQKTTEETPKNSKQQFFLAKLPSWWFQPL